MKAIWFGLLVGLSVLCGAAHADVTYDMMGVGMATAISADGTIVVGNTQGDYETFRWTLEDGIVPLGLATVPVLGSGAGAPDISADGTRISATILGRDSTYATQGIWTDGVWQETMPPTPPDGGLMGDDYGSAWGLSSDGSTLVGLYWRPGQPGGSANGSAWTEATGVVGLGSSGGNSRANEADYDGDVIVGWDADPVVGGWRPAVWVDGVMTVLDSLTLGGCEATVVSDDGTMVVGQAFDETGTNCAAVWRWNGSSWDKEMLGAVPGTFPGYGAVYANDVTADGSMIVGYNAFDWNQATGFIWTEETGMVDVEDYLVDNGITLDPWFDIRTLTGVSDDGTVMVGIGMDGEFPFYHRSFIIRTYATGVAGESEASIAAPRVRAFPNPMVGATTLSLTMPRTGPVSLEMYDVAGRLVRRVADGSLEAGPHEIPWDGRDGAGVDVPSGIYFCRLNAGEHEATSKVTVLR